jgi:hypothetical protein
MKRRSLLKAIAVGSLTMSPLASLLARSALAADVQRIRTLFIFHPNGCVPDIFFPPSGVLGNNFPAMSAPLQPVANQLLFLDGIGYEGDANTHEGGAMKCLTGCTLSAEGRSSIDVQMGKEDWENRATTLISKPSIQMGVGTKWGGDTTKRISYNNGNTLHPVDDPRVLYPQLFGGSTSVDPNKIQILARAKEDINRLRTQLGSIERERLEQHVSALDVLEQGLNNVPGGCMDVGTSIKPRVDSIRGGAEEALWATQVLENISAIQQDIAVASLSCNITRSISFMYGVPVSPIVVPGTSANDHDLSHQDAASHTTSKVWWMAQLRQFIQKLAATPDVNGSLLDNTIVCTVSDLAHGNWHNHHRIPMLLAGGKNTGLITGRSVDLRPLGVKNKRWGDQTSSQGGVNHSNVLMTIAEKAGYRTITLPTANGRINNVWINGTGL